MSNYPDPSIYDILHAPGSNAEVAALSRIACRHGLSVWQGLHCLEPACGTGRLLRLLERRGGLVYGFDADPAMLEYAQRGLSVAARKRLFVARMESFATQLRAASIDVAFTTINSIRHLESDAALLAHLRDVAFVLRPTGVYVVGISLSDYGNESPSEDLWHGGRGRCRVDQMVQYLPPADGSRFERVISHWIVRRPTREEHFDHSYDLRCYDESQWQSVVDGSAMRILDQYDDRGVPMPLPRGTYRLYALSSRAGER